MDLLWLNPKLEGESPIYTLKILLQFSSLKRISSMFNISPMDLTNTLEACTCSSQYPGNNYKPQSSSAPKHNQSSVYLISAKHCTDPTSAVWWMKHKQGKDFSMDKHLL